MAAFSESARRGGDAPLSVRFSLFSDLHANLSGLPARGFGGRSMEDLARGLERFREAGVSFAVSLGDNLQPARDAEEEAAQLSDMMTLWDGYGFPVHLVPGNHEFQQLTREAYLSLRKARRTYGSFTEGGARFILLDTNVNPDGSHYSADNFDWRFGILDEEQILWLAELLKTPVPTVVFAHNCIHWDTGDPSDARFRLQNAEEIRGLLAGSGCVRAVFQGHHHTFRADRRDGILYVNVPSPERYPAYSDACFPVVALTEEGITYNGIPGEEL